MQCTRQPQTVLSILPRLKQLLFMYKLVFVAILCYEMAARITDFFNAFAPT